MKKQKVIIFYGQAKYDLSDNCCFCQWFINSGQKYVKSTSGKSAHYGCAKENGWRAAAKTPRKPEQISHVQAKPPRAIKIVRKGQILQ